MEEEFDETENQEDENDYTPADVDHVMRQHEFRFWGQLVDWLRKNGANDYDLTPSKAQKMLQDFSRLQQEGVDYTNDPEEATKLAKERRGQETHG